MAQSNIYCKIELIKDPNTGQLSLTAHLNPQAKNITTDEQTISWKPTREEQHFLVDAIHLLKNQQQSPVVTFTKKQPKSHIHEKEIADNEIESINQTIDNLPVNKTESTQKEHGQDTIEQIIKQNTKHQ
ncbi:MAG TPA: hypothetical protein VKP59_01965 [Candidatus Thermoplasmatota archaeon]|nr:hypothetical protein [Candidatus Thermoplasmatota archaeon]